MLNLYLISQNVNSGYDTYDSAVVAAASEDDARKIHPRGSFGYEYAGYTWVDSSDVTVKLIGVAAEWVEANAVICASFNAG